MVGTMVDAVVALISDVICASTSRAASFDATVCWWGTREGMEELGALGKVCGVEAKVVAHVAGEKALPSALTT